MTEEFNLSEKIAVVDYIFNGKPHQKNQEAIAIEDVKEFIKRLKEELGDDCGTCKDWNINLIDKLAGDELIIKDYKEVM